LFPHFIFFSKGEGVRPSWFLVSLVLCITLVRKSLSIYFYNKLTICIFRCLFVTVLYLFVDVVVGYCI